MKYIALELITPGSNLVVNYEYAPFCTVSPVQGVLAIHDFVVHEFVLHEFSERTNSLYFTFQIGNSRISKDVHQGLLKSFKLCVNWTCNLASFRSFTPYDMHD